MEADELVFTQYGFERDKDAHENPKFGDNHEPLYVKGFWKRDTCYFIKSSRNPHTLEYELHLGGIELPGGFKEPTSDEIAAILPLEEVVAHFKRNRSIPPKVDLGLAVNYGSITIRPTHLRLTGSDFGTMYNMFEQALIGAGYLQHSIREEPSRITKGRLLGF